MAVSAFFAMPKLDASAKEYPTVDMFEHVKTLHGEGSLKGAQGAVDSRLYAYTDPTGTHGLSHSFWNADLDEMILLNPVEGAEKFTFEGKNYYFDFSSIEPFIQICNSQLMTCNIQFMLHWDGSPDKAYLVDPKARVVNPPEAPDVAATRMYAMDVAGQGRRTFRAFWRALMKWCSSKGYHIDNFILGNEVNAPNIWNYFGTTDVNTCTEKYAISFFDMYQAVREYTDVSRCSVCLDHSWNESGTVIGVKTFLDDFHKKVTALNSGAPVDWCLSMHLWPARLDHPAIWTPWNGKWLATDSVDTLYVDGSNLNILTDHIRERFGAQHRVMLTEQGFVQDQGEQIQAASLAYSYYAALYDPMVDNFIIFDFNGDGMICELLPLAREVYEKIGSSDEADRQRIASICLPVIGASSWEQIIPGLGGSSRALTSPGTLTVSAAQSNVSGLKEIFDERYYADRYPDLRAVFGYDREALWTHFVTSGLSEGRVMNSRFDVVKYRKTYADLNAAFGDNWTAYLEHYLNYGEKEGRQGF